MADPTERPLYRSHPSWLYFPGLILFAVSVFILSMQAGPSFDGVVCALLIFVVIAFARFRRLYTISANRIIMRVGLVANNTNEMEIRHIRGINVRQGVIQRLLGIGTLEIISAADGGAEVVFSGVRNPNGVKEIIRGLRPSPPE